MNLSNIALLLLASGTSSRFGRDDKLLASLGGQTVLAHAARALAGTPVAGRIAVTGAGHAERRSILENAGWTVVTNLDPAHGQGRSLAIAMTAIAALAEAQAVMILLADMPFVPDPHLIDLATAMTPQTQALMSSTDGILGPPALFARSAFDRLQSLDGDQGARKLFLSLDQTRTLALTAPFALDIDTAQDLHRAQETLNG